MTQISRSPVFLDLLKIKLPVTGIVSIAHRISGLLLFLAIPLFLYLLGLSLSSEAGFQQAAAIVRSLPFRFAVFFLIWALLHHLLAGVRFLLIDLDIGVDRQSARASAFTVILSGVVIAVLVGVLL